MSSVFKAFNAVQKAMSEVGIAKGQRNKQQGYQYRGIDDVYNTLGPLMAEHGLTILPRVMDAKCERGQTKSGGTAYHHHVVVEMNIYGPDGDKLEPSPLSRGECIDTSDKGLNKALSAAYKYWVLSAFCVPLEGQEDADDDTPEPIEAGPPAQQSQERQVAQPPLTPDQRKEILGLCMQTNTNVDQFVAWLGYNDMSSIPVGEFERIKGLLGQKLSKQSHEYEAEQRATAQSMN